MSEPDFDIDMVVQYLAAAVAHGKEADLYAQPKHANIKIGYYVSYELVKLRAEAVKAELEYEKAQQNYEKEQAEEQRRADDPKSHLDANKTTSKKPPPKKQPPKKPAPPPTRTEAKTAAKVKLEIPGTEKKTFELPMKYVLTYTDVLLKVTPDIGPPFEIDLADYTSQAATAKDKYHHLTATRVLGDAVNDDGPELARCGFVYHADLTGMSSSARQAYGKKLDDITYVPADVAPDSQIYVGPELRNGKSKAKAPSNGQPADQPDDADEDKDDSKKSYFSSKGFEFRRLLAATCTYTADGTYFPKWTSDALKRTPRSFTGPNLRPEYLARATGEWELEQGYYYGLLLSPVFQRLYRLSPNPAAKPGEPPYRLDRLIGLHESQLIPPGTDPDFDSLPRPDLIIFKAVHGLKKGGGAQLKAPAFRYHKAPAAYERLADPQREVEGDLGPKAAKKLRASSDFDWFVELAKLRFTEDMYRLDIKRFLDQSREKGINEMTFLPEYRKSSAEELAKTLYAWAGDSQMRIASLEPMRKLIEDENVLLVPQGLMISEHVKFVGCDSDWAYARDLEHDVTIKMPHEALIADLSERYKLKLLYENSEGVIYFSQIVVWGGLAAMGLALIPGVFSIRVLYRVVANRVRSYAVGKAVKQVLIYEIPAMAAVLAQIIGGLFDSPSTKLWVAFSRGFFKGYAVNTLKKIFYNIENNVAKELLKEFYLYQRIKKLHHVVKKLSEKYEELSNKLTREQVEAMVKRLETAAKHAMESAFAMFHAMSFLEHKELEDVVVGLTSGMEDPVDSVTKSEWYIEAKEGVLGAVDTVHSFMSNGGKEVFDKIDGAIDWIESHEEVFEVLVVASTARHLATQIKAMKAADKPRTSRKKIILVVVAVLGGVVVLDALTDGESTEIIGKIGQRLVDGLPGENEADAEIRGKLYGNALGALFFDHGLIGKDSSIGRLAKNDDIAKRVTKGAKVGIVMSMLELLIQRYISFFRKALGYDGHDGDVKDLLKDASRWRTDRPELQKFEQFRSTETGVNIHEIVSSVLNIERFLDGETRDRWASKWGPRFEAYEADVAAFKADAEMLGIEQLVKKHAPVIGHSLLLQLRFVVKKIRLSFEELAHEIEGSDMSLLRLVEMLGFDLGDLDKVTDEFDKEIGQKLQEFVKK